MKKLSKLLVGCTLALILLFAPFLSGSLIQPEKAYAKSAFSSAPVNPDFKKFIENGASAAKGFSSSSARSFTAASDSNQTYGYFPSPVTLERTDKGASARSFSKAFADALPESFNTGLTQYQTSVKDQGTSGACWSFASLASMESFL